MFFALLIAATSAPSQPNSASSNPPAQAQQQAAAPIQAGVTPLSTAGGPSSASPQTQAHMSVQSPASVQVKGQGGAPQLQLQQTPQLISVSGLPQQVQVFGF